MMLRSTVLCATAGLSVIIGMGQATAAISNHSQRIDTGRQIYLQRCAACHGVHGEGQPNWQHPNAIGELPAPPHGTSGHTWKHSDAMLFRIIHNGWRDPFNKTKQMTMPAFGQILTSSEITAVTLYLKTLWTPKQRNFQEEESKGQPFPDAKEHDGPGSK